MARRDLYVFDLDGTLVDTLPDITRALNAALAERGVAPRDAAEVRGFLGTGGRDLCRRALGGEPSPEIVEQVFERYRARYRDSLTAGSRVYPGIAAVLGQLGAPAAVITNKAGPEARGILAGLGLGTRFVRVIGDGDGLPRKPDPAAIHELITLTGAERALFVGDSEVDAETARRARVDFVWVSWGYGTAAGARRIDRADQLVEA
jgi:phosphoglycolate phosphatase